MLRRATSKSNQQGKQGGEVSVIIHLRPRLVKPLFLVAQMVVRCFLLMPTKWSAAKLSSARSHEDDHAVDIRKNGVQKKDRRHRKKIASAHFFFCCFLFFYFISFISFLFIHSSAIYFFSSAIYYLADSLSEMAQSLEITAFQAFCKLKIVIQV